MFLIIRTYAMQNQQQHCPLIFAKSRFVKASSKVFALNTQKLNSRSLVPFSESPSPVLSSYTALPPINFGLPFNTHFKHQLSAASLGASLRCLCLYPKKGLQQPARPNNHQTLFFFIPSSRYLNSAFWTYVRCRHNFAQNILGLTELRETPSVLSFQSHLECKGTFIQWLNTHHNRSSSDPIRLVHRRRANSSKNITPPRPITMD